MLHLLGLVRFLYTLISLAWNVRKEATSAQNISQRHPIAKMGELAKVWEEDGLVRNRGRDAKSLTLWPSPKSVGVASMRASSMNARVLEHTATWWVQRSDLPAAIPIDAIRYEARTPKVYPCLIVGKSKRVCKHASTQVCKY